MIQQVNYATYSIDHNDDLRIVKINEGFTLLTGYTKSEVLGKMTLKDIIPSNLWDEYLAAVNQASQSESGSAYLEHPIQKKDGTSIVVLCFGRRRPDHSGLSDILITDITSHIEAHNEVRRQEKERRLWLKKLSIISENEEEYIADFNSANDHFDITIIKDGQTHIIYSIDDYTKKLASIPTIHPEDLVDYAKIFTEPPTTAKKTTFDFRSTLFNKEGNKDDYAWYRAIYAPYFDEKTGEYHLISRIVNIDEEVVRNEELQRQAQIDSLTNLYNQGTSRSKIDDLALNHPENRINAFIIMDLDNFKDINDTFGHAIGDEVLKQIGNTLKRFFRFGSDVIGRLGGDEFVIYVQDFSSPELVKKRSIDLCHEINKPMVFDGKEVRTSVSIGVAIQDNGPDSFDHLYKCADRALYAMKNSEKNGVYIYSESPHTAGISKK